MTRMYPRNTILAFRRKVEQAAETQTDEQAVQSMELYATWESKLGVEVPAGERLRFGSHLYKVRQKHTPQLGWEPDKAVSLFVIINPDEEAGTKDNPIAYALNMELEEGKYYTEEGVLYHCIRALAQSVWHLADLVGNYVEIVT